ncbi:MAG: ribonuclease HII, partial [Clostridium sp.]|nr:ribonuclease HII [Clostridium sp.]
DEIQEYLRRKHRDNKGYLPLVLEIPVPADYMSIINFYAGDL